MDETVTNRERDVFTERYTSRRTFGHSVPAALDVEVVSAEAQLEALNLEMVIPQAELCARLREAVQDAAARDAASMKRLRAAVESFTVALRDMGTTPERVLIALKTVINNRSFVAIAPHVSDWNGDSLRERVSSWCIEAFFRKDTP